MTRLYDRVPMQPLLAVACTEKVKVPIRRWCPGKNSTGRERHSARQAARCLREGIRAAAAARCQRLAVVYVPPAIRQGRRIHGDRWAARAVELDLVYLKHVLRRGVRGAGRQDKHVAHLIRGIDVRPAWGGAGRVVVLSGPETAQERVA